MNVDSLFGDTFDNISFSPQAGKILEKNLKDKNETNTIPEFFTESKSESYSENVDQNTSRLSQKFSCYKGEEISVDDSIFLSEYLSTTFETSKKSSNTSTDDIFEDDTNQESSIKSSDNSACLNNLKPSTLNTKPKLYVDDNKVVGQSKININNIGIKNDTAIVIKSDIDESMKSFETQKCNNYEYASQKLDLSSWGLSEEILKKYKNRKIKKMFEWQFKCLSNEKVLLNYSNLVYSAPTSAGKTLVAEILAIKTVLERQKKVLFILPFVSVVQEKVFYFQDILGSAGIRVEGFMGSYNPPGGFNSVQVAICTIEKGNSLVNRMLEESTLNKLGAVVVDEMHLLGDSHRGYLLELLLTKLLYMTKKREEITIQIIGMSATMPNLETLAKWLQAELFVTTFRPIPLYEKCYVSGEIYSNDLKLERRLTSLPGLELDTDNIFQLCLETLEESCSVLIFCPTKNWCETLSQQISVAFWKLGSSKSELGNILRNQLNSEKISELLEQLRRSPVGLDTILKRTVSFGVAFHHAGLTLDERNIIEGAFRNGTLRVLVATSTLSSGVNLPAKRVIIRTPIFNGKPVDILTYKQMIGRAGRLGRDTSGESILICQKTDRKIVKELLCAELDPVVSCLEGTGKLKRAILEVIASGVVSSADDIKLFANCTLLGFSENYNNISNPIEDSVSFLKTHQFIRLQEQDDGSLKYIATPLAKACLSSSLPPEEGLALFTELEKARQCFVLENELHLVYLVTPYSACNQWSSIDWMLYLDMWEKLPVGMKKVGELVGISESYIVNATRGNIKWNTSKLHHKLQIHKRFYTALALQDLVNEIPLARVASKFNCARGMLQSLQQSASTFSGMVTAFSRKLGWSCIEILFAQFQDRLQFGVNRDLLGLMKLPILNGPRARALFNNGIESLAELANSDVCEIENILHALAPFESEKERDGESEFDARKRNKIRNIWITGIDGLTERDFAVMLIQDARSYLQLEMGLKDAKWESDLTSKSTSEEFTSTHVNEQNDYSQQNENIESRLNIKSDENKIVNSNNNNHAGTKCSHLRDSSTPLLKKTENSKTDDSQLSPNESFTLELSRNSSSNDDHVQINLTGNESFDLNPQTSQNDNVEDADLNQKQKRNSNDSGLEELANVSFVERAFLSSFDTNELLPQKMNDLSEVINETSDDDDDDVVASSQDMSSFVSNKSTCKKAKKTRSSGDASDLKTPSKKKKMSKSHIQTVHNELKIQNNVNTCPKFSSFNIVNVCDDEKLFKTFSQELIEQNRVALSIACEALEDRKRIIGTNIINNVQNSKGEQDNTLIYKNKRVVGISLSWGMNYSYFILLRSKSVGIDNKICILKKLLEKQSVTLYMFDCKEQVKILKLCCNLNVCTLIEDPKIADWLLNPEEKEKSLKSMVLHYCPNLQTLLQQAGCCKGVSSIGLDEKNPMDSKLRSSVEVIIIWHMINASKNALAIQNPNLLKTFKTEMDNLQCLIQMELNGIAVNVPELQKLVSILKDRALDIERQAFNLAGRRFSFTSSKEVAKVLGIYKGKKVSTNKQVLEQSSSPIANLVIHWRKLNSTLTKMIYPLIRIVQNDRIHGTCIVHSATGRISMQEPNLQNVPRNFEILNPVTNVIETISCRDAFVASKGYLLLSADYCQLELRLLAHLSRDKILCSIMKTNEDVFKSIAARTNDIKQTEVTDTLRQRAKQICYGIIYGMGTKALAEQLCVSAEDALEFAEKFHIKYPSIKKYINKVVENCRKVGYVETLAGRRRFLPHIKAEDAALRSQAERQSVNTTIQGSAADIAKRATVLVHENFKRNFPSECPKFILQLHDEFLFEVIENKLKDSALILKKSMEEAVTLSIPFPVKLKYGRSWGCMKDLYM